MRSVICMNYFNMKTFKVFDIVLVLAMLGVSSCMKTPDSQLNESAVQRMEDLVVNDDFDWKTTNTVDVTIQLPQNLNILPLSIFNADGQRMYFTGYPEEGSTALQTRITIPAYEDQLRLVFSAQSGMPDALVPVQGSQLTFDADQLLKSVRMPCDLSGIQTFSQLAWHATAQSAHVGNVRDAHFEDVFPAGLTIGDPAHFTISFQSSQAIAAFLPAGGSSKVLTQSYTNPSSAAGIGNWAGQIAAAMLNVYFDEAAVYPNPATNQLKDLVFLAGPFRGMSIGNFLTIANQAIGGGGTSGYSINEIAYAAEQINTNFESGNLNYFTCSINSVGDGTGPTEVHYTGTLAYEDLWPWKGDYDFNDMVISYDFNIFKNVQEQVRHITATFTLYAFGASYYNGFGFSLPSVPNDAILSVTGSQLKPNTYVQLLPNGLEQGQNHATIIVFDDAYDLMQHPGIGIGVNTDPSAPYVAPVTFVVEMSFMDNDVPAPGGPVTFNQLNIGQFNPFIIVNQNRQVEVHLPGYAPTAKANLSLLGSGQDNGSAGATGYYKTTTNLPWAINIPEVFKYPIEKQEITGAYLHFADWAESSGQNFPDWFKNLPGYTNSSLIYPSRQ